MPLKLPMNSAGRFAAVEIQDEDDFVAGNITALKEAGLVEAGVPRELGGGGASHEELAENAARAGTLLRVYRAGVLDAHPSGRGPGLALDTTRSLRAQNLC